MRRLDLVVLAVVGLGCGRVDFDAVVSDDAPHDIYADPFGEPIAVTEINTSSTEDDVSLTDDLLEIYFASDRSGAYRVWFSSRTGPGAPWSAPVPLTAFDSGGSPNNPRVSGDGLELVFASTRAPSAGGYDLWMSTRATRGDAWPAPVRILELATSEDEFEPWLTSDHQTLYFSLRLASDEVEIYQSRRTLSGSFAPPILRADLSGFDYDGGTWVHESALVAMLHSERNGPVSQIFKSRRSTVSETFTMPELVAELDDLDREEDPWLSPDLRVLAFVSTRTGNSDIYFTTR